MLSGYSVLVVRVNINGNLMPSKPCEYCREFMQLLGIKWVYYSDEGGHIVKEKVVDMKSYVTFGTQKLNNDGSTGYKSPHSISPRSIPRSPSHSLRKRLSPRSPPQSP